MFYFGNVGVLCIKKNLKNLDWSILVWTMLTIELTALVDLVVWLRICKILGKDWFPPTCLPPKLTAVN